MNITIMSRVEMEKLIKADFPCNTDVISFKDIKDNTVLDFCGLPNRIFSIVLDDLDIDEIEEYGLNTDTYFSDAEELALFIKKSILNNTDIICQCEYGQSRSAACAAAIMEFFDGNGISIFCDYRYYPNKLIFNKLLEKLKGLSS